MDRTDEVPFASLETGTIGVGAGGSGGSGGQTLSGTGFGNERTVPDCRVIVIFGGMCLATDVTGLGVEPSLPRRIRRSGRRRWWGMGRTRSGGGLEGTDWLGDAGPSLGSLECFIFQLQLGGKRV